ncbi:uncharacterized protein AB675_12015 [Cyphellophora attinorum]|uniref:G domain-containing protein n=1 Tax=Cyphellophora attinorum TaxID=1664694 RepID=A0A0N1P031_9EURO|nr:uncharacterized protein AB675_12015 [Phialophora attinorum]KPI38367.1 hypothetical protein AB675_12015 [Phialophora attinorum]
MTQPGDHNEHYIVSRQLQRRESDNDGRAGRSGLRHHISPIRPEEIVTVHSMPRDIKPQISHWASAAPSTRRAATAPPPEQRHIGDHRRQQHVQYITAGTEDKPPTARQPRIADAREDDIVVLVMGMTGSGKSSFINLVSDRDVRVGHSLTSCTTDPEVYPMHLQSQRHAYLIDTPGFDDTSRGDADVLRGIAAFLHSMHQRGVRLAGLLYLHRITDLRMTGSARKNLELLRSIVGPSAYRHVTFVTTMWQLLTSPAEQELAEQRCSQLESEPRFWKDFIGKGSKHVKHDGSKESARKIIEWDSLSSRGFYTRLQQEMARGMQLDETLAGSFLKSDFEHLHTKWEKELSQIEQEIESARAEDDKSVELVLLDERDTLRSRLHDIVSSMRSLRTSASALTRAKNPEFMETIARQERQEAANDPTLADLLAQDRQSKKVLDDLMLEKSRLTDTLQQCEELEALERLRNRLRREDQQHQQRLLDKGSPLGLIHRLFSRYYNSD